MISISNGGDSEMMSSEEPITNRAEPLLAFWEKRLAAGEIDEAKWYREITAEITPAYLSADNPRTQSGFAGDEAHWIQARGLIADAIDRAGTFLDVGCANGYLMDVSKDGRSKKVIGSSPMGWIFLRS